jgi:KDO2-lipid IV(A) lauroyltransferase
MRLQASLPLRLNQFLGWCFGSAGFWLGSRASEVTAQNLKLCFPDESDDEIRELTHKSMRHTGMTAFETPSVWLSSLPRKSAWIGRVENESLLTESMAKSTGTVVLLPHLGNWEMFNVFFANRGRMTALYHPPRQDWLKPLMEKVRGDNLVPTNRQGLATLYRELRDGHVVTVLPDQVPASGGFAPFFGEPALTDRLVPRMLAKTGAEALTAIVFREAGQFHVRFEAVDPGLYSDDADEALVALNRSLETAIGAHLDQYQWEYKRFRERPSGFKKLYKFKKHQIQYYHD